MSEVRIGQLWKDNDPRVPNRYLKILDVKDGYAYARVLAGKQTKIKLSRFKPTSTGYILISEYYQ
jgi:hypothetical protein